MIKLSIFLLSALLIIGCGERRTDNTGMTPTTANMNEAVMNNMDAESDFVNEAVSGGLMEVQLGNLASQKAASDDVKKFGRMMVTDHSKANIILQVLG